MGQYAPGLALLRKKVKLLTASRKLSPKVFLARLLLLEVINGS
jgi:hypothetical protein